MNAIQNIVTSSADKRTAGTEIKSFRISEDLDQAWFRDLVAQIYCTSCKNNI